MATCKIKIFTILLLLAFLLPYTPVQGKPSVEVKSVNSFPHTENFSSTIFPPPGWINQGIVGSNSWRRAGTGHYPSAQPLTGGGLITYHSYDYDFGFSGALFSPGFDIPGPGYQVRISMFRDDDYPYSDDRVEVFYNTQPQLQGAVSMGLINRPINMAPEESETGWYNYSFPIPYNEAQPEVLYFIFQATSDFGFNMHIDAIYFEATASEPLMVTDPAELSFGMLLPGEASAFKQLQLINIGEGILEFNQQDIVFKGEKPSLFETGNINFPVQIPSGGTTFIPLRFIPSSEGEKTALLEINYNSQASPAEINLSGLCYLPLDSFSENFDNAIIPHLPDGWKKIASSAFAGAAVETTTMNNPLSVPNQIRMYNGVHPEVNLMLISPKVSDITSGVLSFNAFGSGCTLQAGIITDPDIPSSFQLVETFSLNEQHQKFFLNFSESYPEAGYIALKHGLSDTGQEIFIDDVKWKPMPEEPVIFAAPADKDFGKLTIDSVSQYQTFKITNTGEGPLVIDPDDINLQGDSADFLFNNIQQTVSLGFNETAFFEVAFAPETDGSKQADIIISGNTTEDFQITLTGLGHDENIHPPFTEDFTGTFPPEGWSRFKGYLADTVELQESSDYHWIHGRYGNDNELPEKNAASLIYYIGMWDQPIYDWLITPKVIPDSIAGHNLIVSFDVKLNPNYYGDISQGQLGEGDYFAVVMATSDSEHWSQENVLLGFTSEQVFDNQRPTCTINLGQPSSPFNLAFYGQRAEGTYPHTRLTITNIEFFYEPAVTTVVFNVNDGNSPINNAAITIEETGATLITDSLGNASTELNWGLYHFSASAQDMQAIENQEFEVNGDSLILEIELSPVDINHLISFQVLDQDNNPVENATIIICDTADLLTDSLGLAFIELPEGNYLYNVDHPDFYPLTQQQLIVENEDIYLNISLTSLPDFFVVFNVRVDNQIYNPAVDKIYITGDMLQWSFPGSLPQQQLMMATETDPYLLSAAFLLKPATYEYKYYLNAGFGGAEWVGDPNRMVIIGNDTIVNNVFGDPDDNLVGITGMNPELRLYPNPASSSLVASAPVIINQLWVINTHGQTITHLIPGKKEIKLNFENPEPGLYFIKVETQGKIIVRKILIN